MGRITGVSAAETRARLLSAAAAAFQAQGFEGTRVADIASGAGVSNGALYSHFSSKSELLAEALHDHAPNELADLFLDDPDRTVVDLLVTLGEGLIRREPDRGALVVEGLVAARRDGEVAATMGGHMRQTDAWLVDIIRQGQADGTFAADLAPEVVSRYCLMVLLGSILMPAAGLAPVDEDDWATLMSRLGDALRPVPGAGDDAGPPAASASAPAAGGAS